MREREAFLLAGSFRFSGQTELSRAEPRASTRRGKERVKKKKEKEEKRGGHGPCSPPQVEEASRDARLDNT